MCGQCVPGIPPAHKTPGDKAVSHGSPTTRVWLNFESQLLLSWMSLYYNYVLFQPAVVAAVAVVVAKLSAEGEDLHNTNKAQSIKSRRLKTAVSTT